MSKTLGLDLSCSVCGYCISEDNNIIDCGFFDISIGSTYKEKSEIIIKGMVGKSFDVVVIEESLSGFSFGGSNATVILKLAKNKAVISYILEERWGIKIHSANAVTMRKQLFGISRIKGIPPKKFVKDRVDSMYDMSKWIILNKRGNVEKRMEDVYDAVVCSFFKPNC